MPTAPARPSTAGTAVFGVAPGDAATTDPAGGEKAYLVDKNGYYVQGWAADETGSIRGRRHASPRCGSTPAPLPR